MTNLIITVTCDTTLTYPQNPNGPKPDNPKGVADEYVRAIDVGASICHTHGSYTSDPVIQPDGRQLQIPVMEGWREITERIRSTGQAILQFGLASIRLEQKLELWRTLRPDMSSINFNSHDEYFQPDPKYPPAGYCYSIHPISELREYSQLAKECGVKLEIECFSTGAFWAIEKIRAGEFWVNGQRQDEPNLLADPLWVTLFLGWPGQGWTPPSAKGLQFMVDHLPANTNWSMSCMAPTVYWSVIAHAIAIGGHVRVGMEDCPYLEPGVYATSNAQLVEKAVRIAREIGRNIATPEEARSMTGLA
jgi:3-keto-5-aminohexanoate cleavage enzyme